MKIRKLKYPAVVILLIISAYSNYKMITGYVFSDNKILYQELSGNQARQAGVKNRITKSSSPDKDVHLNYGTLVRNHFYTDIFGNKVEISGGSKSFKLITISRPQYNNRIDNIQFDKLSDISKNLSGRNIFYIHLAVKESKNSPAAEFKIPENRKSVKICPADRKNVLDIYKLKSCNCGYIILLDPENRLRLATSGINTHILEYLVKKEMQKEDISVNMYELSDATMDE